MKNLILILLVLLSCSLTNQKPNYKLIERDKKGRVIKTYDSKVYDVYDTLGRLIESWGNLRAIDWDTYFHFLIYYTDTTIFKKEYHLGYKNSKCIIKDSLDYFGIFYKFNKYDEVIYIESTSPIKDDKNKVIGRKISSKHTKANFDVREFYSLPKRLR